MTPISRWLHETHRTIISGLAGLLLGDDGPPLRTTLPNDNDALVMALARQEFYYLQMLHHLSLDLTCAVDHSGLTMRVRHVTRLLESAISEMKYNAFQVDVWRNLRTYLRQQESLTLSLYAYVTYTHRPLTMKQHGEWSPAVLIDTKHHFNAWTNLPSMNWQLIAPHVRLFGKPVIVRLIFPEFAVHQRESITITQGADPTHFTIRAAFASDVPDDLIAAALSPGWYLDPMTHSHAELSVHSAGRIAALHGGSLRYVGRDTFELVMPLAEEA